MSVQSGILTRGTVVRRLVLAASISGLAATPLAGQLPGPGGLTAAATSATTARLSWLAGGKVLSYQVVRYRSDNPKTPELTSEKLGGATAQWDDAGLMPGVTYQYVVAAHYQRGSAESAVSLSMPATLAITDGRGARSRRTPAALATSATLTRGALASATTVALADLTRQPPGTYPPVSLAIKPWSPSLHEVTWGWDGVHGFSSFQVYKLDPTSPGVRLVRDGIGGGYRSYWDTAFVAPNSTTYRVVGYHADGSWGSADIAYPNPPQPVAPPGFTGVQISTGAVKFSWQTVGGAIRYRLYGPTLPSSGLPVGSVGVSNIPATHIVTGIPLGPQTFGLAAEYAAGVPPNLRASTTVTVRPTSGNYRVLVTGVTANHESVDDQFSMDGKGDEIYVAAFWGIFPYAPARATSTGIVETVVYGDANKTPSRVQAGSGSATGGIRTGDVVPNGFTPNAWPGIAPQAGRFPLLVWQGTLQDSGQAVAVNPLVWETDNNQAYNFQNWRNWFLTPNGGAILKDVVYATRTTTPLKVVWFGMFDDSGFPFQPGIDPAQGTDRPIGIGGLEGLLDVPPTPNANSIGPTGVVLTREVIERTLAPGTNAILIALRKADRASLAGDYTVYLQIERLP